MNKVNMVMVVTGFFICVFGLWQTLAGQHFERWEKRFFTAFFCVLLLYAVSTILEQLFYETRQSLPYGRTLSKALLFGESAMAVVLMLLLTAFLLYSCGIKDWPRHGVFLSFLLLMTAYLALLIYAQFSTAIYYYDAQGVYHRGPLYPLLLIPPLIGMLIDFVFFFHSRRKMTRNQRIAFSIYLVCPALGIVLQMMYYGVYIVMLSTVLSALAMFIYIQRDQTEKYYVQQQENEKLKVDIMLAQIQPHFLYNSLLVIQQVCLDDPETAAEAIGDFTKYLQHNMESLESDAPVRFTAELEHVRAYMHLQQIRFGDALQVEYDIQCDDFYMPALTLQPIVENAVKYGVRKNEDGHGKIVISSRETEGRYEIRVTDDGPGFSPGADLDDGKPSHIGIRNVSERLALVSGGELRIQSQAGRGTVATILLPKGGKNP